MAVEIAKGIHDHPHLKLGAVLGSGKRDKKTISLDQFIKADIAQAPASYDFDKHRKPFAAHMWGNDSYGDCEIAGRCNYLVRLERVETRSTPPLVDQDAVDGYKAMTGCESPGDNNDTGLTSIDNLNAWRHGWPISKVWKSKSQPSERDFSIFAYGEVDHKNTSLVRLASYLFHGILIGADLPVTVQSQFENHQVWDVVPNGGNDSEPGSWGGHCMYGKAYDRDHMKLLTWKEEVVVTNEWWDTYVDEAFCVIDAYDSWRRAKHVFDVDAMVSEMKNAGISVNQ